MRAKSENALSASEFHASLRLSWLSYQNLGDMYSDLHRLATKYILVSSYALPNEVGKMAVILFKDFASVAKVAREELGWGTAIRTDISGQHS